MKVYRTKGGYYYKELKNGKKTRISKEQYQKLRKKQAIKGGDGTCRMCRKARAKNNTFYEKKNIIDLYLKNTTNQNLSEFVTRGAEVKKSRGWFSKKGANNEDQLKICQTCNGKIITFKNDLKEKYPCLECHSTGRIIKKVERILYIGNNGRIYNSPGPHCTEERDYINKESDCPKCNGNKFSIEEKQEADNKKKNNAKKERAQKAKRRNEIIRNGIDCTECSGTGRINSEEKSEGYFYNARWVEPAAIIVKCTTCEGIGKVMP
jgi:hypothetical protein